VIEATDPAPRDDPLDLIEQRMRSSNPLLYRHLALYLQVLREVLPTRVQQACFHLATQVHPQRYLLLPLDRRQRLHDRLGLLVQRCLSLLTVEQLAVLAALLARERLVERERLLAGAAALASGTTPPPPQEAPADLPPGSVQLDVQPPLSMPWTRMAPPSQPDPDTTSEAAEVTPATADDSAEDPDVDPGEDQPPFSLWLQGDLPKEPVLLLQWLLGVEQALAQRLRNLSHALNVELLRGGLSDGLPPLGLLDAALAGQLEALSAPPNLLRWRMPFAAAGAPASFETVAILLRLSDLELEEPRLRTCRRRLRQHSQELRTMAREYRLLQRRHQAREAERLWLQDIRNLRLPRG
jgi:hypothetical protein